ncbi:Protein Wnt-5 [Papilio xuthus]|uniref:Protein Wnt n=1 Tax=Papilio xuthus TaxID=66420 RepID=A0A194PL19_PAPXU|nr:Protein Wnt-5 [Papilio xuthus]
MLRALHESDGNWTESECGGARRGGALWGAQARACRRQPAAMPHVAAAARLARNTCLATHAGDRWNCSSIELAPRFTPDLLTAAWYATLASLPYAHLPSADELARLAFPPDTFCAAAGGVSTDLSTFRSAVPDSTRTCSPIYIFYRLIYRFSGTREQAYVYAISAAALSWTVARACAAGTLAACSCATPPRAPPRPPRHAAPPEPHASFKWGGCGDNLQWAERFAKQFLDAHEIDVRDGRIEDVIEVETTTTEKPTTTTEAITAPPVVILVDDEPAPAPANITATQTPRKGRRGRKRLPRSPRRGRPTRKRFRSRYEYEDRGSRHRNIEYRMAADDPRFDPQVDLRTRLDSLRPLIAAANLINLRFGRKVVSSGMRTKCTCHGVSGSCSVRTCWRALPSLTRVAAALAGEAARAGPLKAHARRRARPRPRLRYVTPSPDYCEPEPAAGSLGTHGRKCNASLGSGAGGCARLCCGRGRRAVRSSRLERCRCRYHWCCRVDCQLCRVTTEEHYCN